MGYCPWGRKELDTTERLSTAQFVPYAVLSTSAGTIPANLDDVDSLIVH